MTPRRGAHRWRRARVALALAGMACTDGPSAPSPSVALRLCTGAPWLAYRNEGEGWRRAPLDGDVHAFDATDRVEIATGRFEGEVPYLRVDHVTASQAQAAYGCAVSPPMPLGVVLVEVRGLAATARAHLTYGAWAAATAFPDVPVVGLHARAGTHDLVAVRWPSGALPIVVDVAIVRRAQSYADGERVTIDLASPEAVALERHTVRWTGPAAVAVVIHHTASGNASQLAVSASDTGRSAALPTFPLARQLPTDVHEASITGDDREVALYYRTPRDRDVAFGPPAAAPNVTRVASSPHLRVHAVVPVQADYAASVRISFEQGGTGTTRAYFQLAATREYVGDADAWSLTVPDLRGVPGFQPAALARTGAVTWSVQVTSRPTAFTPVAAVDGEVMRTATARGSVP